MRSLGDPSRACSRRPFFLFYTAPRGASYIDHITQARRVVSSRLFDPRHARTCRAPRAALLLLQESRVVICLPQHVQSFNERSRLPAPSIPHPTRIALNSFPATQAIQSCLAPAPLLLPAFAVNSLHSIEALLPCCAELPGADVDELPPGRNHATLLTISCDSYARKGCSTGVPLPQPEEEASEAEEREWEREC